MSDSVLLNSCYSLKCFYYDCVLLFVILCLKSFSLFFSQIFLYFSSYSVFSFFFFIFVSPISLYSANQIQNLSDIEIENWKCWLRHFIPNVHVRCQKPRQSVGFLLFLLSISFRGVWWCWRS